MKAVLGTAVAALLVLSAGGASASERTVILALKNMSCVTCGPIVHKSLARVAGVKRVDVSASKGTAIVVFDDAKTNVARLVSATTKAGFPSRPKV